jgi:hypothetical protein
MAVGVKPAVQQPSQAMRLEPGDILTPEQLAERLQVGVNWVYEKSRARGKHNRDALPVLRCGRYLRFSWPDVCAWLRSQ